MQTSTFPQDHKSWNSFISSVDPTTYKQSLKLVHQAIQLVAATSRSILPTEANDAQSDLFWMPNKNMLAGRPVGFNNPHQIAFDVVNFQLVSLDRKGEIIKSFKLAGNNTTQALSWLDKQIASNISISLDLPYELPFVPTRHSRMYDMPDPAALGYICTWLTNTSLILGPISLQFTDCTLPVCKPESLDVMVFSTVKESEDQINKIELGMSLGDSDYPSPYFYNIPHPAPAIENLPYHKGIGKWHTFPWVGMVLTSDDLLKLPTNAQSQHEIVEAFFRSSYEICLKLF